MSHLLRVVCVSLGYLSIMLNACGGDAGGADVSGPAAGDAGSTETGGWGTGGFAGSAGLGGAAGATTADVGEPCLPGQPPCSDDARCMSDPSDTCTYPAWDCPRTCRRVVPSCTEGACGTNETCWELTTDPPVGVCIPRADPDALCEDSHQPGFEPCVEGYYCGGDWFNPRCTKIAGPGEACDLDDGSCVEGYRCRNETPHVCVKLTPLHGYCMNSSYCEPGLFCEMDSHLCEEPSDVGGECSTGASVCEGTECYVLSESCKPGLQCVRVNSEGCFAHHDCSGSLEWCCANDTGVGFCTYQSCERRPVGQCMPR